VLDEAKIAQLDTPDNAFTPRERMALEYAEKLAVDHHAIDDAFFERLREHFDDAELLELGMMAGQYIGFGRLLKVLDLTPRSCPIE
jgi:alkylhydroperoxidase family enzyme